MDDFSREESIFGFSGPMAQHGRRHPPGVAITVVLYSLPEKSSEWIRSREMIRKLYLFPILLSAMWFGALGAHPRRPSPRSCARDWPATRGRRRFRPRSSGSGKWPFSGWWGRFRRASSSSRIGLSGRSRSRTTTPCWPSRRLSTCGSTTPGSTPSGWRTTRCGLAREAGVRDRDTLDDFLARRPPPRRGDRSASPTRCC